MAAAILVWSLVVLALAQPQRVGEPVERVEAARDVVLAIDISASMDTRDFEDARRRSASSASRPSSRSWRNSSRAARATASA